ncbi:MAG: 23S rRNA (adenine(2030)-N(6))-methyltransferase RlmJ [Gammaproteobacteria bacterium]|nr:23S rRNA (adenine(2030)-N(6))-methyltransferase RlmJ [Gammaproteobacteria bacterium]
MLSYRHEFHAGNVGDLIKHSVLSLIIDYLKQKPAPIRYIDTHAGAGLYSTRSAMAAKTGEYGLGAGAIVSHDLSAHLGSYMNVLTRYAARHQYPGSPLLAAELLRAQDKLWLYELHTTEFPILHQIFARDRRVHLAHADGYAALKGLLPVQNARALVLLDPSYETQSDYAAVTQCVEQGYSRMPHGVFAIWYPVVNNPALAIMIKKISAIAQNKLWRFELTATDGEKSGMTATGMLVINPPWTLARDLEAAFQKICPLLPFEQTNFTATCIKQ